MDSVLRLVEFKGIESQTRIPCQTFVFVYHINITLQIREIWLSLERYLKAHYFPNRNEKN